MPEARTTAPARPPALSCGHLSVGYGTTTVLHDISLEIGQGLWTAIVGPNGSGKSTLLRVMAGLARPQAGELRLLGRPHAVWTRRERARRIAWLAQSFEASDLCAAEVVALGRFAHAGWLQARRVDDDTAIARAMALTGCAALARRRVSALSGGERQRVHLARVLAVEASVLLLDEPTTHLDPPHQEDVARLLRGQARSGVTVVSAIHDLSLALSADRLIVLGARGIVGIGSTRDALTGDWLSLAFGTRVHIVEHDGVHLWRPSLEHP